jgi:hypothetical protein
MAGAGRRGDPWKRFRAARWYPAEWVDGEGGEVRLTDGSASAVWPREDVEIRAAADDAWDVRALSRLSENRDGQTLDYPARIAECPEGHVRTIPTRFDAAVVALKCAECRRAYRLESPA